MKMRAPTEAGVHLALTSGHTFVVTREFVDVPKRFVSQALDKGCLREGEEPADADTAKEPTKLDLIKAAIKKMVEAGSEEYFGQDGKPKVQRVSDLAGFTVTRQERDEAWAEIEGSDDHDA